MHGTSSVIAEHLVPSALCMTPLRILPTGTISLLAFSALTLLVGRREGRLA